MSTAQKIKQLYTDKQIKILKRTRQDDWFMIINHGAVRAGKTILDNDLFLYELRRVREQAKLDGNDPMYILGATSAGTLQTNILRELSSKYGIEFKFDRFGNFTLFGVYVVTTFTATIAGLKSIRGMTSYGAYVNEATLANKEVFDEIIKRCSGNGARIILDTNPDQPNHWLKRDYIDKADGERVLTFHFALKDNTFLNKRYVENLIATTPSGVFTDRGIHGLWVSGEGVVYRDFDDKKHYIDKSQVPEDVHYFVGVDWGYEHYGSMVVMAQDAAGNVYLVEEHAKQHEEIDYWATKAKTIANKYGQQIPFYCDSARPEHVARLINDGFMAQNANKAVISGIEQVAKLIKSNQFKVVEENVKRFKDEITQYVWKDKKDEPVKEFDDVLDAVRYGIYSNYIISSNERGSVRENIDIARKMFR